MVTPYSALSSADASLRAGANGLVRVASPGAGLSHSGTDPKIPDWQPARSSKHASETAKTPVLSISCALTLLPTNVSL